MADHYNLNLLNNRYLIHLRDLYIRSRSDFEKITRYLPYCFLVLDREGLSLHSYYPESLKKIPVFNKFGRVGCFSLENEMNMHLFENALTKINLLNRTNSLRKSCSFLLQINLSNQPTYVVGHLLILDNSRYLLCLYSYRKIPALQSILNTALPKLGIHSPMWKAIEQLTSMERKLINLFAQRNDTDSIAERCAISYHTVRTHKKNIYKKLGISTIIELVKVYTLLNLIENQELLESRIANQGELVSQF